MSILASLLSLALPRSRISPSVRWLLMASVLSLFSLGNRLQPPVLRALLEWVFRSSLKNRGWRPSEISLISTWIALPFCATTFDLLSLALSFFASVTVEKTSAELHRRPLLALIAMQTAVWWILSPLLFTLGLPHPLSTLVNVALAPLLGVTLIPLAMAAWASGVLPVLWGRDGDPLQLGAIFDLAWIQTSRVIAWLASVLPEATPRLRGSSPLFFGLELSTVLLISLFSGAIALLVRTRREGRTEALAKSSWSAWAMTALAIIASVILHGQINTYIKTYLQTR